MSTVLLHPVAILKGVVEGDPYLHLGSLLGAASHIAVLVDAGLVTDERGELTATDAGRAVYERHHLAALPAGRANSWSGAALEIVAAASTEITGPVTSRRSRQRRSARGVQPPPRSAV